MIFVFFQKFTFQNFKTNGCKCYWCLLNILFSLFSFFFFLGLPIIVKIFALSACGMLVVVFPIAVTYRLLVFIWAVINILTAHHCSELVMLLFHTNFRTEKFYSMFEDMTGNSWLVLTDSTTVSSQQLSHWKDKIWILEEHQWRSSKGFIVISATTESVFSHSRSSNRWNFVYWNGGAEKLL